MEAFAVTSFGTRNDLQVRTQLYSGAFEVMMMTRDAVFTCTARNAKFSLALVHDESTTIPDPVSSREHAYARSR